MADFRIKLAGIPMQVHALFDSTARFCQAYWTEDEPLVAVTVTRENLEEERRRCAEEEQREGDALVIYPPEYLETLVLYRLILEKLLPYHVLLFHGSAVALNGKAYLFTAKSGVGKTTHTRLWLKNIPGAYVLNGDKPLLLFQEDAVYVCGTPWQGKENYGVNEMLPLRAVCVLERGTENRVESVLFHDVFPTLATQAYCPGSGAKLLEFIQLIGRLNAVPLYRLSCNMEDEAALVAYHAIVEDG